MFALGVLSAHLFARGGGGGSGGGGSLGIALIGYVPMHLLGACIRKVKKKNAAVYDVLQVVGWVITVVFSIVLILLFRGFGVVIAIGAFLGMGAGLYGWLGKLRPNKQAEQELHKAAAADGAWDPTTLMSYAAETFQRFQNDWSKSDVAAMQAYLTPWYHYHVSLMMLALKQAGRVNQMSNVQILSQNVQRVNDSTDNSKDQVTIGFDAKATDALIDVRDGSVLFTDNSEFVEYWNFQRSGSGWLLSGIDQATANLSSANAAIQQFAISQRFCYSLDWGWLLLPQRGQLFGNTGRFGTSDINNHVIGVYNNILIQIYTYTPVPNGNIGDQYLVAQVQLPKSYGDILVRKSHGLAGKWFGPKGLTRVEMEWPDFNKKYEVFTSTAEGPTSFELLHPVFMETLEAAPFEVNLEVVENVVYFYTKETTLSPDHYPAMLAILQEAFKQMRM